MRRNNTGCPGSSRPRAFGGPPLWAQVTVTTENGNKKFKLSEVSPYDESHDAKEVRQTK